MKLLTVTLFIAIGVTINAQEFTFHELPKQIQPQKRTSLTLDKINKVILKYVHESFKYPSIALENAFEGESELYLEFDDLGQLKYHEIMNRLGFGMEDAIDSIIKSLPTFDDAAGMKLRIPLKFRIK